MPLVQYSQVLQSVSFSRPLRQWGFILVMVAIEALESPKHHPSRTEGLGRVLRKATDVCIVVLV